MLPWFGQLGGGTQFKLGKSIQDLIDGGFIRKVNLRMKLAELEKKLVCSSLPDDAYCLSGGLPNEAYCIEHKSDGKWHTYYSERGLRTGLKTFDTEDEAYDYFFTTYMRD